MDASEWTVVQLEDTPTFRNIILAQARKIGFRYVWADNPSQFQQYVQDVKGPAIYVIDNNIEGHGKQLLNQVSFLLTRGVSPDVIIGFTTDDLAKNIKPAHFLDKYSDGEHIQKELLRAATSQARGSLR